MYCLRGRSTRYSPRRWGGDGHARGELYAAVSGHHGGPQRFNDRRELWRRTRAIGADAEEDAKRWTSLLLELLPRGTLEGIDQQRARKLGWVLSGLTVATDWVASNTEWFPSAAPDISPRDYLERARNQAADAVTRAGLNPTPPATGKPVEALAGVQKLRPMQAAADVTTLPDGPMLALIEDATGAGKIRLVLQVLRRVRAAAAHRDGDGRDG